MALLKFVFQKRLDVEKNIKFNRNGRGAFDCLRKEAVEFFVAERWQKAFLKRGKNILKALEA